MVIATCWTEEYQIDTIDGGSSMLCLNGELFTNWLSAMVVVWGLCWKERHLPKYGEERTLC